MECFFLVFFYFSCFAKAREAVEGLPNRECSYTELTLKELKPIHDISITFGFNSFNFSNSFNSKDVY